MATVTVALSALLDGMLPARRDRVVEIPVLIGKEDGGAVIASLGHVVGNVNGNNTGNAWHKLMKCADQPSLLSKKLGITEAILVWPLYGRPGMAENKAAATEGREPKLELHKETVQVH